jgi:hypothetical protein
MDRAACRGAADGAHDPLFFSDFPDDILRALAICDGCPVRAACREYAVTTGQEFGVWGGLEEASLRRLTGQLRRTGRVTYTRDRRPRAGSTTRARRTHCPQGHAFDEANTYVTGQGKRQCVTCRQARAVAQGRQLTAERTHCPAGHAYDEANTYLDGLGRRRCRGCLRIRAIAGRRAQKHGPDRVAAALEGGRS